MASFVIDASATLPWCFDYDAAYLALALRDNRPLATLDIELKQAARAAGVRLIE